MEEEEGAGGEGVHDAGWSSCLLPFGVVLREDDVTKEEAVWAGSDPWVVGGLAVKAGLPPHFAGCFIFNLSFFL